MLHLDGFEQFQDSNQANPTLAMRRADYLANGSLTLVAGRASTSRAVTTGGGASNGGTLKRIHPWTSGTFAFGAAIRFTNRGSMMWLKLAGAEVIFWLDPDTGWPYVNGQQGGALPIKNTWYFYELTLDRANKTGKLSINNRDDVTFTITPTMAAATSVEVGMGWRAPSDYLPGSSATDSSTKTYDDIYIHDGARLGPVIITTRPPTTDVNAEWYTTEEGASHSSVLSLTPPEPNDQYVASNTIGQTERFVSSRALPNDNPIIGTGVVVLARKSAAFAAKMETFLGGGGGDAALRSETREVGDTWRTQYICFEQQSGDTKAGIEAAPFGVTVASP